VLAVVIDSLVGALDAATAASHHRLVGDWPFVAQLALFVITHDFYIY
jgi:hypothetical protein